LSNGLSVGPNQEVPRSSLTHCAAKYGPGQLLTRSLPLSPSSIIWYWLICYLVRNVTIGLSLR